MKRKKLTAQENARFFMDVYRRGATGAQQMLQWVESTYWYTLEVSGRRQLASPSMKAIFWVRSTAR
jgi:hypothetical protein